MRGARGKGPLEKGYYEVVGSEGGGEGYSLTLRMPRRGLPLPLPPSLYPYRSFMPPTWLACSRTSFNGDKK